MQQTILSLGAGAIRNETSSFICEVPLRISGARALVRRQTAPAVGVGQRHL